MLLFKRYIFIISSFILISLLINCKKEHYYSNNSNNSHRQYDNPPVIEDSLALKIFERDTILKGDTNDVMRILKIWKIENNDTITIQDDSVFLRKKCHNVRPDTTDTILHRLIRRMYHTLILSQGVGIAAPQVGINRNIIWVKRTDKVGKPFEVYLNPKIVSYSNNKIIFYNDGCLSIPSLSGRTDRYSSVYIEYDKIDGTHCHEIVEGYGSSNFTAVIFQHEIDHLNGILFIDKIHQY